MGTYGVRYLLDTVLAIEFGSLVVVVFSGRFQFDNFVDRGIVKHFVDAWVVVALPLTIEGVLNIDAGYDVIEPGYQANNIAIGPEAPAQDLQAEQLVGTGVIAIQHFQSIKFWSEANKAGIVLRRVFLAREQIDDIALGFRAIFRGLHATTSLLGFGSLGCLLQFQTRLIIIWHSNSRKIPLGV